jgi:hypothetical protein
MKENRKTLSPYYIIVIIADTLICSILGFNRNNIQFLYKFPI